jgi:hypothetical protein
MLMNIQVSYYVGNFSDNLHHGDTSHFLQLANFFLQNIPILRQSSFRLLLARSFIYVVLDKTRIDSHQHSVH